MIDLKKLKDLVELMAKNDLTELDIQDKEERVTLKRGSSETNVQYLAPPVAPTPAPVAPSTGASPVGAADQPAAAASADDHLASITSPMVGTFYATPSPDAEPFVKVGDRVSPDTVVCIIEAMKVFNEIKAELSGTVQEIAVNTGDAVEYGQALYRVKPD